LRASMWRDWIIAANMKHQPLCDGGFWSHNWLAQFVEFGPQLSPDATSDKTSSSR
jgi:hypothetical protein